MSNDNYDLFTYFADSSSFSTGTTSDKAEPAPVSPSVVTESTSEDPNGKETNVVSFSSRRGTHIDQTSTVKDNDSCETEDPREDDEDRDAMSDDPVEDESAANKAELVGKSSIATNNSNGKGKKEEEKPVFNQTTYICYSGMSLPITKYFTDDLANLTLEDVRKRLEKDFPELSKQRTKMEWEKSKNIICPMVTGGKKGSFFRQGLKGFFFRSKDLAENKQPINILAARDGYFEVRENAIGVFVSKLDLVDELEACREAFKMKLPKIPKAMLCQLITFFADYADQDVEVLGAFYWDSIRNRYILDVPQQFVTKVSVDARYSEFPQHYIKVCEIHSHNTMRAYFSSIDDNDEVATMLYGVAGRMQYIDSGICFDMLTRAGVAGRFIPIEPGIIFAELSDGPITPVPYPIDWQHNVKIVKGN